MTSDAKKIARARLFKRLGIIGLITTTGIIVTFLVLSLLPHGEEAFSVRVDDSEKAAKSHFSMVTSQNSDTPVTYLRADPMPQAKYTSAPKIEEFLASQTNFEGSQNYKNEEQTHQLAMVYSIYLNNTSSDEEAIVRYAVNLDGHKQPENTSAAPIEYFRILVQTEIVDSHNVINTYYGHKRTSYLQIPNENNDDREPISIRDSGINENLEQILVSKFKSNGNDGYCKNFGNYELGDYLVDDELTIPAGKSVRYTFVAYYEENDLDCTGSAPENSYLLLSLHFGI